MRLLVGNTVVLCAKVIHPLNSTVLKAHSVEGRVYEIQCHAESDAIILQKHLLTDGWSDISCYQVRVEPKQS